MKRRGGIARILGHSANSVIHWMGANGGTKEDTFKAVMELASGYTLQAQSIYTAYADGKNPKYSKPAPVSSEEERQLREAVKRYDAKASSSSTVDTAELEKLKDKIQELHEEIEELQPAERRR